MVTLNPIPWQGRALAVLLLVLAAIAFGAVAGLHYESNRRDAQELKQKRADDQAFQSALASGHRHAANVLIWQRRARTYYRNWQERLNHEKDSNLAQCAQQGDLLLSGAFVGMYNAAWRTELDPIDPGGAAAEVIAAGAVTPRHVLENVRENAELCGEDRKRHDELIDLLTGMGAGK